MLLVAVSLSGLVGLLCILVVLGLFVSLLTTYVPMPSPIRSIIIVVAALVALLLVCNSLGVFNESTQVLIR